MGDCVNSHPLKNLRSDSGDSVKNPYMQDFSHTRFVSAHT